MQFSRRGATGAALLGLCSTVVLGDSPTVKLSTGTTYQGLYNGHYEQDHFLGIPYAQPPTGDLRFAPPEPIVAVDETERNATEYSPSCIGYGADTTNLGNYVSEDCLTINIVRPAGTQEGDDLPVVVWIHGGSYVMGGSSDPRYNLSKIVSQSTSSSADSNKEPIIAASINYRLSMWGHLFGAEVEAAGAGNLAFRDQRLALRWVRDEIARFGGDPARVTLWGESAGARSIGMQLVGYEGGQTEPGGEDVPFHGALMESGSPVASMVGAAEWQPYFDAVVEKAGCGAGSNSSSSRRGLKCRSADNGTSDGDEDDEFDVLACLRALPVDVLNDIFNKTTPVSVTSPAISAVLDGDFMTAQGAELLRTGRFARVPLLLGNNFDEGTAYGKQGISTDAAFEEWVGAQQGVDGDADKVDRLAVLYPDLPGVGIPASLAGRPAEGSAYGAQWKRAASFAGDYQQHAGRRLTAQMYSEAGLPVYSYRWDVYVNGIGPELGATHFQEVAFVFDNTEGTGYAVDPFEGKPETFDVLADRMSMMWVEFVRGGGNPNLVAGNDSSCHGPGHWPVYTPESPLNYVFDVNVTDLHYIERDDYRQTEIASMLDLVF